MSDFFIGLFIKDHKNTKDPVVRGKYGILSACIAIAVNIMLTVMKFICGLISASISITADAINNLSDAGSGIVSLFGFKMAARKPDKEHPFGHGRIEYVAALIVGFLVELMGVELIKSSVEKLINPTKVTFSTTVAVILVISILAKLFLAMMNRSIGKKIDSPVLSAAMKDSFCDIVATSLTLFSLIISIFTDFPVDAIFGIGVSLFIMYSGFGILKESIGIILGEPPTKEFAHELTEYMLSFNGVLGIHDLVVHSYGASRLFGSVHLEVAAHTTLTQAHNISDTVENAVKDKFDILLVAHIDPVITDNKRIDCLNDLTKKILCEIDSTLSFHDLRVIDTAKETKVVFDILVPYDCKLRYEDIADSVKKKFAQHDSSLSIYTTVEGSLI